MSKHKKKLKPIKALLLDCDGVLTDGKIWQDSSGNWKRNFFILDGMGIKYLLKKKILVGIISGSNSKDIEDRCTLLGIQHKYLGTEEKESALNDFIKKTKLKTSEIAYMGDDIIDIPVLKKVGFSVTVPNAVDGVFNHADYITKKSGGNGAVREVCDLILKYSQMEKLL